MTYIYRTKTHKQRTLATPIFARGVGVHSGKVVSISLHPAGEDQGIIFQRTDLGKASPIVACIDNADELPFRTAIACKDEDGNYVMTVEHLMAAFYGCGVDNATVYINGPEVPIFDGSSQDFVFLLDCAGYHTQKAPRKTLQPAQPYQVRDEHGSLDFVPTRRARLRIFMDIHFPDQHISRQRMRITMNPKRFRTKIAANRTFIDYDKIPLLRKYHLGQGGSLENTIVVKNQQILNPLGLRNPKEFVGHKILDALGDLFLSGCHLYGDLHGCCSGHRLNIQLLKEIFSS